MLRYWVRLCSVMTLLAASLSVSAAVVWDESVDGDLSSDNLLPTPIMFSTGSNTVSGSMVAPTDTRDYITFEIGQNQILTGILLVNYQDLDTGGPGNRGFVAINEGDVSAVPAGNNSFFFLAGAHLDPFPSGTNLLDILENQALSGTGLSGPLGPGVYSFLVQQTGPQLTGYTLDFQVTQVPVPGALVLFGSSLLFMVRRVKTS